MNIAFGTGERFNTGKFYLSKEMAAAQIGTKCSPGPIYQVNANVRYPSAPPYGIGTTKKNPLNLKPPYYAEAINVQSLIILG